jgi:aryl-alcohol dehydrogenase-like predicted oxidoreductase
VPLAETLEAFDNLAQRGLVRYVGASNYVAWRLMKAVAISEAGGLARFDSLQPSYSLANRSEFERELEPLCLEESIGVIPYSPLAAGFLTGKYRREGAIPDSARSRDIRSRYMHERGFQLLDCLDEIAGRHGATTAQIALAWLLVRPSITSPIIGSNSVDQWRELAGATEIQLTPEDVSALDEASSWS